MKLLKIFTHKKSTLFFYMCLFLRKREKYGRKFTTIKSTGNNMGYYEVFKRLFGKRKN